MVQNLHHPLHEFWPDSLPARMKSLGRMERFEGHRQATDAYLVALASARAGRLATFDSRMKRMAGEGTRDLVELVRGDAR